MQVVQPQAETAHALTKQCQPELDLPLVWIEATTAPPGDPVTIVSEGRL